jgi:adenosylhomocysteine nucleosidase
MDSASNPASPAPSDTATPPRVGILAPMALELDALLGDFDSEQAERVFGRTFHRGTLHGCEAVVVVAGIGKTAVATTTTLLVKHFGVECVLLTGVAGRVSEELKIGDVVVATELVHHDLDASPIFPRYHVPTLGTARLATDAGVTSLAYAAARSFVAADGANAVRVVRGLVLSGDQFMKPAGLEDLRRRFPDGLAVEMEGAAVAQVCIEAGVPYAVVRTISDDGHADAFEAFLIADCGRYAAGIVSRLLGALSERASLHAPHQGDLS